MAWDAIGGPLPCTRPLAAQNARDWHRSPQSVPTLPAAAEGPVVLLAGAAAVDARAIQNAKRGIPTDHDLLNRARAAAESALSERSRRLRAGVVG